MNNQTEKPRVVIIGAGFGGLWAAKKLHKEPVEIFLLDRNNYHSFWPLLYQVGSAELEPSQIAYPVRAILRRQPNVRFVMAEVTAVDTHQQQVKTADPHQPAIAYDYLVLASGSTPRFFGIPGAEAHTFPLKTMEDGIRLRNQILRCFETAEQEKTPTVAAVCSPSPLSAAGQPASNTPAPWPNWSTTPWPKITPVSTLTK
jgi:NADH:ubiquinone reductase (H+-translocating)